MPYVSRDENGRITGISERQSRTTAEFLPSNDPDVQAFVRGASPDTMRQRLSGTDTEMARITEDLIDVLITRNIINFTDLPVQAQKKLVARQKIRRNLSALSNLVSDSDDIF
jgi:hypothetical protein